MVPLFPDTHPEAEAVLIELLRQTPPWRKLHMVEQLNQMVRTLALAGLRQRYPEATPQELQRYLPTCCSALIWHAGHTDRRNRP